MVQAGTARSRHQLTIIEVVVHNILRRVERWDTQVSHVAIQAPEVIKLFESRMRIREAAVKATHVVIADRKKMMELLWHSQAVHSWQEGVKRQFRPHGSGKTQRQPT